MKTLLLILIIIPFSAGCSTFSGNFNSELNEPNNNQPLLNEEQSLAILFCEKTNGTFFAIGDEQLCVLDDGVKVDLIQYYLEECKPLGEKCIALNPISHQDSVKISTEEFSGKIYTTPSLSNYDDYILMTMAGEEIRYGLEPIIKDKNFDHDIEDKITALTNTDKVVVIKGTLLRNVADVGGHRIIVEKIFPKDTNNK